MGNKTAEVSKERGLSSLQLRREREKAYRTKIPHTSVYPRANGRNLSPASESVRKNNFLKFVELYFSKEINKNNHDPESDTYLYPTKLKKNSDGYEAFSRFAETDYGSSVIKEMINNLDKYKGFIIMEGVSNGATGLYRGMTLPKKFPNQPRFRSSGQIIYDLAIIYHEFAHSMVFLPASAEGKTINIEGERSVVMKFENPVRISKGYEPRYSYTSYRSNFTINIITGEKRAGTWGVSKYDAARLVKLTDKDVLK